METQTVWSLLEQAGWTMLPLYLCSLVALAVGLYKAVQFRQERVGAVDALRLLDDPGDPATVPERLGSTSPLARVLGAAARAAAVDPTRAEGAASRAAVAELDRYESWLAVLSYIVQAAPLFGLLGTVLGMVDLFASMQMAGTEISTGTLSSGIWKALLTTVAGLIIAIPTLGAHMWFTRRLELLQHRMESGVGALLARLS